MTSYYRIGAVSGRLLWVYVKICFGDVSLTFPFLKDVMVFFLSVLDDILWVPIHCNVHPVIQMKVMMGKRTMIFSLCHGRLLHFELFMWLPDRLLERRICKSLMKTGYLLEILTCGRVSGLSRAVWGGFK